MGAPYTAAFYRRQCGGSRQSAREVVPVLIDLVGPRSVVDVGCGVGTWLSAFAESGVTDVCGVDGDWVDPALLEIPRSAFVGADLTRPLALGRSFDLVLSLEVAEHLPASAAETFVDSLSQLGPIVAFSAAVPQQGGLDHVNEQWPEYWADRFQARGYVAVDAVRPRIWTSERVEWFYAQNLLLFARPEILGDRPRLRAELGRAAGRPLAVVHPRGYLELLERRDRLLQAIEEIDRAVPAGEPVILVDQAECGTLAPGRRVVPFLERDGRYWGPPADDAAAIAELGRLRRGGLRFLVFAWPAFWWLEHYSGFLQHLQATARRLLETDRVIVFDLAPA